MTTTADNTHADLCDTIHRAQARGHTLEAVAVAIAGRVGRGRSTIYRWYYEESPIPETVKPLLRQALAGVSEDFGG